MIQCVTKMRIRKLEEGDFDKAYLELLKQLTYVGEISQEQFRQNLSQIQSNHHIMVMEHDSKIVATGTLLVETKFIHQCGRVGHIEDIVVDSDHRQQGLGQQMISHLVEQARHLGCYKVILDCSGDNVVFYQKCGFRPKEQMMAHYFE